MSENDDYKHKSESEMWNRGDEEASYYENSLEDSKQNPLSQHGDGPKKKTIKAEEMPWELSPQGRLKHVVNEDITENQHVPVHGTDIYIQEIPPGSKSGKHRHMSEELIFVLEGEGCDHHWDPTAKIRSETYEWEYPDDPLAVDWQQEDVIYVPTNTVHQHFNTSEDEPARLLCCQARMYNHLGYGHQDMEQFEAAPEYDEE